MYNGTASVPSAAPCMFFVILYRYLFYLQAISSLAHLLDHLQVAIVFSFTSYPSHCIHWQLPPATLAPRPHQVLWRVLHSGVLNTAQPYHHLHTERNITLQRKVIPIVFAQVKALFGERPFRELRSFLCFLIESRFGVAVTCHVSKATIQKSSLCIR